MWFDAVTGNMIGAIIGTMIGIIGGAWGAVAGVNAPKGKLRCVVLNTAKALVLLGVLFLGFSMAALGCRQPRHVWYPFILTGVILVATLLPGYFSVKSVYTKYERKKMSVDDLS